jgi:hypothetical protein
MRITSLNREKWRKGWYVWYISDSGQRGKFKIRSIWEYIYWKLVVIGSRFKQKVKKRDTDTNSNDYET